ncbi:hypothetical protein GTP81_30470 [Rugamonas sp. FT107W]|uniref:AlgX/AlgJ SGNH hydrolase-like domain-containing protein n=1 Tax=Duganella vulcania TaxID=2692166 RepID=A0A845HQI0_9BURK|nr:hypothetical protein [Duganella vulcania]MYN21068.1 hypothetical protein [Duganella vulcania]
MMTSVSSTGPLRRHAAKIALVALLSIPAIVGGMHAVHDRRGENRVLASLPDRPTDWPSALALPPKLDAWINDNFGFRAALLQAHNRLRYRLFHEFPSIQVEAGRHGRIFLSAHGTNVPRFSAVKAACAGGETKPGTPEYIGRLFHDFHAMGLRPQMMIVPSAPVVVYDDLPAWLAPVCASAATPVAGWLASGAFGPEAQPSIYYPLQEMREINQREVLFPKHWFHWSGAGLADVARLTLPRFGRPLEPAAPPLTVVTLQDIPSDISGLFAGIQLKGPIQGVDFAASGVDSCYGGRCFPEFKEYAETLYDISRFHNPKAPKRRLVMLTDSFGSKVSGWYARYYSDVEQVATNNIGQLSTDQIRRLKEYLFRDRENMDLLILYHDVGTSTGTMQVGLERFHEKP